MSVMVLTKDDQLLYANKGFNLDKAIIEMNAIMSCIDNDSVFICTTEYFWITSTAQKVVIRDFKPGTVERADSLKDNNGNKMDTNSALKIYKRFHELVQSTSIEEDKKNYLKSLRDKFHKIKPMMSQEEFDSIFGDFIPIKAVNRSV